MENTVQDLKLDLIYPRDNTRKYPCVVWICGGAWIQMDRSAHLAYLSVLAQQGFVVASVEYRTSNEAKFPASLQDVKAESVICVHMPIASTLIRTASV